jgi:NitT/TauT family transport system permease protein
MNRALKIRIVLLMAAALALEVGCRTGAISKLTIIPPSIMVLRLFNILWSGQFTSDILTTLIAVFWSISSAIIVGFIVGVILHASQRIRRSFEPFLATYYSVPTLIFYPLIVVFFGLNNEAKIAVGFLHAVVVMVTSTLSGLDRVPEVFRKTSKILRLDGIRTTLLVVLPAAAPNIFTGVKLTVSYAFVGVLGAEFILSTDGLGYQISYAFNNFDNRDMYSLILFLVIIVSTINWIMTRWEKHFLQRWNG